MYVSTPSSTKQKNAPGFFSLSGSPLESEESHSYHAREYKGSRAVAARASRDDGLGCRAGGMRTAVSGRATGDLGSGGAGWSTNARRLVASEAAGGFVDDMVRKASGSVLALGDGDGAEWGIGDRGLGAPAVGTRAAARLVGGLRSPAVGARTAARLAAGLRAPAVGTRAAARLAAGLGPPRAASGVGWLGAAGGDGADGRRDSDGTGHDVTGAVLDARGARGDGLNGSAVDR